MKFFTLYTNCSFLTFYFIFFLYSTVICATPFTLSPSEASTNSTPGPITTTLKVATAPVNFQNPNISSSPKPNENSTSPPPQKPPPALGLYCNETSDCKANFSSCVNQTCLCQAGYINSKENLRCLKVMMKLGDGCSEDEQCSHGNKDLGPTTCLNFICSCAIGMSLVDDKCQGPKVLNSNCTTDEECTIKKSHCREGLCTCFNGFISNSENNICLPVNTQLQKVSGGPSSSSGCTEDVQCQETMGDQAICEVGTDGGSCQCQPGNHLVKNICQPYMDLGNSCSHDVDCVTENINTESEESRICNNNVCKCNTGWIQENNICKSGATQNFVASILFSSILLFWLMQRQ